MKSILLFIFVLSLLPMFVMSAEMDPFVCQNYYPDNTTIPNGYAYMFDMDNAVKDADYHTIEWYNKNGDRFFINFSNHDEAFLQEDIINMYYIGFDSQMFSVIPAPDVNSTIMYNSTLKGYNSSDVEVCTPVDIYFEGKTMGLLEIQMTTPIIIMFIVFIILGIAISFGLFGSDMRGFGGFIIILEGIILLASSFNIALSILLIGIGVMLTVRN